MKVPNKLKDEFPRTLHTFLFLSIPLILLLVGIDILSTLIGKPLTVFFQDIFYLTSAPLYYGFISNIGMIIWSAAAAVCFYTFFVIMGNEADKKIKSFFFISGLLTLLLLFDDFFMFHEVIYPRFLHIESNVAYIIYALMGISYLIYFRKVITENNFLLLLIAFGFFFLSILTDEIRDNISYSEGTIIYEDGFKLLGTGCWLGYFVQTGAGIINRLRQKAN